MFQIRPNISHFALWLLLAPLFLLEVRALEQLQQTMALQAGKQVATLFADVTAERTSARGPEVRYQFAIAGYETPVSAMNTAGWGETWIPISQETWQQVRQSGQIEVLYLLNNPSANQPIGRVGSPIGDSLFGWFLFLAVDCIWLAETFVIIRNYLRSQSAAERRQSSHIRFWRTIPAPTALDRYARATKRLR